MITRLRENGLIRSLLQPRDYTETSNNGLYGERRLTRVSASMDGGAALVPILGGKILASPLTVQAGRPADLTSEGILAVGVLTVIVTVAIAIWQRRDLNNYRKAKRALSEQQAEQERLRQLRHADRESWEPIFLEIKDPLDRLEDTESELREQGPLDCYQIDVAALGKLQRRLENVSARSPEALRAPLQAAAAAVGSLRNITVRSDADITNEYAKTVAVAAAATGSPAPEIPARAIGAKAIEQYKAAVELHDAIGKAWEAVHFERGDRALQPQAMALTGCRPAGGGLRPRWRNRVGIITTVAHRTYRTHLWYQHVT